MERARLIRVQATLPEPYEPVARAQVRLDALVSFEGQRRLFSD